MVNVWRGPRGEVLPRTTPDHDYKHHGTTDVFAALNVATGEVFYAFQRSHSSAHKAPPVANRLAHPKRARWLGLHFTPTSSSSWLKLVERWFNELTVARRLRRGVFTPVAPRRRHRNVGRALERRPQKPFGWHKPAEEIIATEPRASICCQRAVRRT